MHVTADVTMLDGCTSAVVAEWAGEFRHCPALVPDARAGARRTLARLGWPGDVDDAVLVVSELVTNSVLHAAEGGSLLLRLAVLADERLAIEVSDEGSAAVPDAPCVLPAVDAESGRGLFLVRALCADVSVQRTEHGKSVRALLAGGR